MPHDLSETEVRDLHCLAGLMIPASAEYGVPGADDPAVFASILDSLGRDEADVRAALGELAVRSGGAFAELAPAARDAVLVPFRAAASPALAVLHRVVLLCYYRDERVMRSLGRDVRPPFPLGYVFADDGDWSLLDPVRSRAKLWRDAD